MTELHNIESTRRERAKYFSQLTTDTASGQESVVFSVRRHPQWSPWDMGDKSVAFGTAINAYSKSKPFSAIYGRTESLSVLRSNKYELRVKQRQHLDVDITFDGQKYIVRDNEFSIYGIGESREEAIRDYGQSFIEHYLDVTRSEDSELGKSAVEYKYRLLQFAILIKNE